MARSVIMENKDTSLKIGLIRPKTAWPYPYNAFDEIGENCKAIIVPEVNIMGLMIDDVRIAANGRWPIYHCGNTKEGSMTAKDIALKLQEVWEGIR
ncbi:hypothetical protein SDC9_199415 [bioreactor metagenome]|uniref:Pyruvate:ferredoxin oxidoreductase core domain-containing protein n=1 Tax=bioreactor metagenome TaxID=1076179 RepID=A0A645IL68_9ZZZZ